MKNIALSALILIITTTAFGQHDHSQMNHNVQQDTGMQPSGMNSAYSIHLPMSRNGSGTGWLPDASPMNGVMFHSKKWMYMMHWNAFVRYNSQDFTNEGSRGASKWDAPNWFMFMGQTKTGKNGQFSFSSMISLDALIAGKSGYPLLFQSGETYNGKPLVDRQHPHDLFSELSVGYTHSFSEKTDVSLYLAYP